MDQQFHQQDNGAQGAGDQNQAQDMRQQLADAFGIADLPEDKQEEILSRAGELIMKRLFLKVMDMLSESDKDAFDVLLGKTPPPSQEEASSFLLERIPNFNEIIKAEIEEFKGEILSSGHQEAS